jgi:predicted ribosomally synthesized peptide with SipW-like signal peptide
MKKIKSALITAIALILTCVISIAATYAYLYDKSETVVNAFSVGSVQISLDEAKVNEYGQPVDENGNEVDLKDAPRVTNNEYLLIPGRQYTKDPTIYVEGGSKDCLVFVLMYIPQSIQDVINYEQDVKINQIEKNNWTASYTGGCIPNDVENANDYELFVYNGVVPASEEDTKLPFFSTFKVDESVPKNQIAQVNLDEIRITAFAIQNEGTENMTIAEVWNLIMELCDPFNQENN